MPKQNYKINPEDLAEVREILFDKSRYCGSQLARGLGKEQNALWQDFNKRGLSVPDARKIAAIMDEWAKEIRLVAVSLRGVAQQSLMKNLVADVNTAKKDRHK